MVLNPSQYRILDGDHLTDLLDHGDPLLFGVDVQPEESEITVHLASAELLRSAGFDGEKGYYVWVPQEQTFVEFNGSFVDQGQSPITFWTKLSLGMKGWVMGYLVDTITREEIAILKNLSAYFGPGYFYSFVNFRAPNAQYLIDRWQLKGMKVPTFGLANLESMTFQHWLLMDPTVVHSQDYLVEFVKNVSAGLLPPTVVSETPLDESSDDTVRKIVWADFFDSVYNDTIDSLVLFTRGNTFKSNVYRMLLSGAAAIFNETFTTFYSIDVTQNDPPSTIPAITAYPALILWPAGHKDEPIVYHGGLRLSELLGFISKAARHSSTVSSNYLKGAKDRLSETLHRPGTKAADV
jgi:hypothetical protein